MKNDKLPSWIVDILLAFCLLTRLPLPHLPQTAFDKSAKAAWAYPVVGAVISGIAVIFGLAVLSIAPSMIAAGVTVAILLICTGCMHEDGLADCADGFWGGHNAERRLEIMKDSQIGSYGTLALIITVGLRWACYISLLPTAAFAVVVSAVLSRSVLPAMMAFVPHARSDGLSRSVGSPSAGTAVAALCIAIGGAVLLTGILGALAAIVAGALAVCMAWLARRKIGGQTGDVLGATQQLSEIAVLFTFVVTLA